MLVAGGGAGGPGASTGASGGNGGDGRVWIGSPGAVNVTSSPTAVSGMPIASFPR
jgi:hypothetical protein